MATEDYGSAGSAQAAAASMGAPSVVPPPAPIVAPAPTDVEAEELAAKQEAVTEAVGKLADAKAMLAQAEAEHKAAAEEHEAAVKALEPVLDPKVHVKLWGGADYTAVDVSKLRVDKDTEGNIAARVIRYHNRNFEHVDTDAAGVWMYREM